MVNIVTSPLIEDSLGHIRDKDFTIEEFRHYSKLISIIYSIFCRFSTLDFRLIPLDCSSLLLPRELNHVKYILPGLGDFGDRYFGT